MDNSNSLKRVAQNILDTSYKVYSDVSLINSSLFRAASSLGVELQSVPQIDLARTQEKASEILVNNEINKNGKIQPEKKVSFFHIERKNKKEDTDTENVAIQPKINMVEEKIKLANAKEQKINKIANELPSKINYKPGELKEDKVIVAAAEKPKETKVSIEEKENKLNKIQAAMPTKMNVINEKKEVETPLVKQESKAENLSSQSELQKSVFETINFKNPSAPVEKDSNEIANNPLNKLLLLVKEKHSITASQAAQSLNVSKDLISRWANILSQNSLIRIKYQLMGDIILEG